MSVYLSVCLYVSLYSYTLVVFSVGRFLPLRSSRLSLLTSLALLLVRSSVPKLCCLAHLPFLSVAFCLFGYPPLFPPQNKSTAVINETVQGASYVSVRGDLPSTACIQYQWSCKGMYCNRFTLQFLFSGWCWHLVVTCTGYGRNASVAEVESLYLENLCQSLHAARCDVAFVKRCDQLISVRRNKRKWKTQVAR